MVGDSSLLGSTGFLLAPAQEQRGFYLWALQGKKGTYVHILKKANWGAVRVDMHTGEGHVRKLTWLKGRQGAVGMILS